MQDACNGSLVQLWIATTSSSGYHLVNIGTGLCLDARGAAQSGTPIELWPCDWISNENWKFIGALQLASGVSGTYNHCLTVPYGVPYMELGLCTAWIGQAWYRPSP